MYYTELRFSNKVIRQRISNGCWPLGAAVALGEDDQRNIITTVQAVFMFSFFPCRSFFVLFFVLRQYVMLFCKKTKKIHFLYISFFLSFTSVVMGKSLCRVQV